MHKGHNNICKNWQKLALILLLLPSDTVRKTNTQSDTSPQHYACGTPSKYSPVFIKYLRLSEHLPRVYYLLQSEIQGT